MKAFPIPWSHAALSPTQTPTTSPKTSPRMTWADKLRRGRCVMEKRNRGGCVVNKVTPPGQAEHVSGPCRPRYLRARSVAQSPSGCHRRHYGSYAKDMVKNNFLDCLSRSILAMG